MNRKILSTITFFAFVFSTSAQSELNSMVVKLLKRQLKELKENPPLSKEDEVLTKVPSFIPSDGKFDGSAMVDKYLDSIKQNVEADGGAASIYETENGELKIEYIDVKTDWRSVPCWQDMYVGPVILSVKNIKGKEVKMPDAKYQEYLEQGFFQQEGSYGRANGDAEIKVYMEGENKYEDYPLTLNGELYISFPTEFRSFTFTAADTGKTVKMGDYTVVFLSMNKNTVMYRVSGPRGFSDKFEKLCTNKDGKPFNGRHGTGLSYEFYIEAQKNKFELSDSRLNDLASAMEKNAMSENTDQLYIEQVPGTFHKITFYYVVSTGEKTVPLVLKADN